MGKKKKTPVSHEIIDGVAVITHAAVTVKGTALGTLVGHPLAGAAGGAYVGDKVRREIESLKTPEGRDKWDDRLFNLGEGMRNNPCPGA
ncbi:hypothetical protein [Nonomuraea sp. NEAU-A123]|uniref:hypothetical protein n=1 Tax=Nonomuraea sp. NEAU-A123 TaxID=2839649 RepID=UPI001BE47C16|nr:hypothetical protein [Nonomuraea sp. NEAU-A123]MBT2224863.1 hypothetical protein [Nonomuraea sp. NEAU-A123]